MLHGNNSRIDGLGRSVEGADADRGQRSDPWAPPGFAARIASGDRSISTVGRIVAISREGATVEVMFPTRGPPVIMLFDCENDEIYECEVRWRTDAFIGVRFLDILGPGRRRLFFADQPVRLRQMSNTIIRLNEPPRDDGPLSSVDPKWRKGEREFGPPRSGRTPTATKALRSR